MDVATRRREMSDSFMPSLASPAAAKPQPPGLLRQIGIFSATALVISNMAGSGIFATTGFMAGDLGSAALILAAWSVGALFALAGVTLGTWRFQRENA